MPMSQATELRKTLRMNMDYLHICDTCEFIFTDKIIYCPRCGSQLAPFKLNTNTIIRTIEFPSEYHQAGISILNYFGTILRRKYPETDVSIQIKQEGLKVSMIITPSEKGEREIIEKTLNDFGLVVTGKMAPEEFSGDQSLVTEMKYELRIAHARIETQKEILAYQNGQLKKKDIQIDKFLELLDGAISTKHDDNDNRKTQKSDVSNVNIFISYMEEDQLIANKMYNDLRTSGVNPWIDSNDLLPGEKWKTGINKAINDSSYFLALLSKNSISKKGYVQKQQKIALDVLDEYPDDSIFVIPVRIDNCELNNDRLKKLKAIDLFPSYDDGLKQILNFLKTANSENKK